MPPLAGTGASDGSMKADGNAKGSKSKNKAMPPRKPAKYGHEERQVVDYVRTATAKNIWYYRCAPAMSDAILCLL